VPLYLTESDIESLVTVPDALKAVEGSFRRLAAGAVANRPRHRLSAAGGAFAVMEAVDEDLGLAGVKAYVATEAGTSFCVLLFETGTATLSAVIEADRLGQLRTGAASGVAAKYLARPGARTLGVIGCGWQAESQVRAIREAVPTIEETLVHCRTPERLAAFCERLGCEPAASGSEAGACDIVVTVTTSADPVLRGDWLRPGALVCAVGANRPSARELDDEVVRRAQLVVCDSIENAKLESGDLIEPVRNGVLDWLEVHELQEVVADELPGRQAEDDIVLFKSNGIAAWDVAVGSVALEKARAAGAGRTV
jgi:ornithine cyclodeaminase/alanine dehydrogenase